MDLSLDNVIEISVSAAQAGVGEYNTSNIALFSHEAYDSMTFGNLGYKIYLSPTDVATDFGTDSETYAEANAIFSQQPNILANNGYLVIIPFVEAVQHIAFSGVAASGTFILNFGGHATSAINWDDTAAMIQVKVRTILGLETAVVSGSIATTLNISFVGYYGPAALMTVTSNSLATSVPAAITLTVTTTTPGETLAAAITRTVGLVQYFGIIMSLVVDQATELAAAAVVQALNKVIFFVSIDEASVQVGGSLDLLRSGGFTQSRGLYYGGSDDSDGLGMMASYAGRGLSTNFDGSNTTQTMHLKDLIGVQPDPSMTQTILDLAQAAGADCYVSLQGVPKVFCSGENSFFDQVYNLRWFVGALQVAGFNFLAESSTKVPQTENGMDGLKGAYRNVCEQAVSNQYVAPGAWNNSTTFGVQSDFIQNVSQRGYYIYSTPIAKQSQAAREARQAPLVQIAVKEAGAIQSSTVIVYVNA